MGVEIDLRFSDLWGSVVHGCCRGLRGCGEERLVERVAVVECNVVAESEEEGLFREGCGGGAQRCDQERSFCCCNGSGRDGSPSSRCMILPFLLFEVRTQIWRFKSSLGLGSVLRFLDFGNVKLLSRTRMFTNKYRFRVQATFEFQFVKWSAS